MPTNAGLKYLDEHVAAFEANGVTPDVWDVDAQGVPHDLGVLGHYDAVLWYLGDNRLTQDPEDELTQYGVAGVPRPRGRRAPAVPDHRHEGLPQRRAARSPYAGETTAYYGQLGSDLFGGIYYGLDGHPEQECAVTVDPLRGLPAACR